MYKTYTKFGIMSIKKFCFITGGAGKAAADRGGKIY
jgi:hypothetical protein